MKKISCILLSAVIFVTMSFSIVLPCFATSSLLLDYTVDSVLSFGTSVFKSYNDSSAKKIEAARIAYFTHITNTSYSNGITIFNESGTRFTDEILEFHFNLYWDAEKYNSGIYDSNLDIFLSAAGFDGTAFDIRLLDFTEYKLSFGTLAGNVTSNIASNTQEAVKQRFFDYYQTLLSRYIVTHGGTATDPNPGKTGLEIAPGYVSGSDLKEAVTSDNQKYFPKNANGKMSFRTDKQNQLSPHFTDMYGPTLYEKGFTAVGGGDEIYLIGFYFDGEKYYYSQNQYHMYIESEEVWMEDRDEIDYIKKTLYEDTWSNMDGSPDKLIDSHFQLSVMTNIPYMYMYPYRSTDMRLRSHENYTAYINTVPCYDDVWSGSYFSSWDSTYTVNINTYNNHCHFASDHDTTCTCNADVGYIASLSPIKMVYDVDTSKIPDDAVITVGGDNIYNYYITNPDTGESSTMNEYITNNYTYITNNNGGGEGSGSSGGVGGNVNVSGEIAVDGQVGVDINVSVPDININVNNNGNGGGGVTGVSPNPEDFLGDSEIDLTSYYDKAVEDASGVRQFLGVFFDFLPAELLGLLCLLVAVSICCRFFGR